jgi:hypothetical protein
MNSHQQAKNVVIQASAQLHMHDVVFHVIFGSDARCVLDFVQASAVRLHSITQCPFLAGMMRSILSCEHPQKQQGPDVAKVRTCTLFWLFTHHNQIFSGTSFS